MRYILDRLPVEVWSINMNWPACTSLHWESEINAGGQPPNITSDTGVFFVYHFIPSCPDSIAAARGTYGHCACSISGKVAQRLLASDQTESVLPSDCPHVGCQGSYLQKRDSVNIKGRLPASNPAVIRFPANLAWGNICPPHWTESSISSRPY